MAYGVRRLFQMIDVSLYQVQRTSQYPEKTEDFYLFYF